MQDSMSKNSYRKGNTATFGPMYMGWHPNTLWVKLGQGKG